MLKSIATTVTIMIKVMATSYQAAGVGQALGSVLCVHQWFLSLREPAGESKQKYAGVPARSN